jgi:L-ascorbate metabolism protein UlaG (beta-lactamase superfamily)
MKLQLLRNATQLLTIDSKTIIIDPMLAPKGSYPPIQNTDTAFRNPTADLPVSKAELEAIIANTDAILLTHIHSDHWDETAREMLAKDIPLFCQPANVEAIRLQGFTNIIPVIDEVEWLGISINRTGGQHGTGEIGERMGMVSGYVIKYDSDILYLAGDTIWCHEVHQALGSFNPSHIVLNGGGARFTTGKPIVMDTDDIIKVCNYAPGAKIYIVHLEAVNHSTESRAHIKAVLAARHFSNRCFVPDDGEYLISNI